MTWRFLPQPWRADWSVEPAGTTIHPLPAPLNGTYSWIGPGSFSTEGPYQYVAWVDDNRKARIALRVFTRDWESSVDLSAVTATALSAQFTLDSHNTITVGVDDLGYVHVCGDHHAVPLKYMRTARPRDIAGAWFAGGMVGTQETQVTYPQFVKAKSGKLFFFYRDGTSGDGDWYLNRWDPIALTWSRVAMVHQGKVDNWSAYPHQIAVDRTTGRWHMLWTLRLTLTGAEGNKNIYYAYSDDEGATWHKTDGSAYTLPITEATGEVVVELAGGTPESVLNGGGTSVDANGRPQSVWLVADSGGVYRYRHVYHDGSIWHYDTLISTVNSSGRAPDIVCWPDGRRWMVFQNGAGGRGNTLRYLDLNNPVAGTGETVLLDKNMIHYTPAMHYSHERGVLYLLAPYERQAGAIGGDPADLGAQVDVPVLAVR